MQKNLVAPPEFAFEKDASLRTERLAWKSQTPSGHPKCCHCGNVADCQCQFHLEPAVSHCFLTQRDGAFDVCVISPRVDGTELELRIANGNTGYWQHSVKFRLVYWLSELEV